MKQANVDKNAALNAIESAEQDITKANEASADADKAIATAKNQEEEAKAEYAAVSVIDDKDAQEAAHAKAEAARAELPQATTDRQAAYEALKAAKEATPTPVTQFRVDMDGNGILDNTLLDNTVYDVNSQAGQLLKEQIKNGEKLAFTTDGKPLDANLTDPTAKPDVTAAQAEYDKDNDHVTKLNETIDQAQKDYAAATGAGDKELMAAAHDKAEAARQAIGDAEEAKEAAHRDALAAQATIDNENEKVTAASKAGAAAHKEFQAAQKNVAVANAEIAQIEKATETIGDVASEQINKEKADQQKAMAEAAAKGQAEAEAAKKAAESVANEKAAEAPATKVAPSAVAATDPAAATLATTVSDVVVIVIAEAALLATGLAFVVRRKA